MTTQYSAEKIFALAAVTAILLVVFAVSVSYVVDSFVIEEENSYELVVIDESDESGFGDYTQILYDPDTLVMYAIVRENDALAMSALYNSDGTLRLYNPEK